MIVRHRISWTAAVLIATAVGASAARAADLTAKEMTQQLYDAPTDAGLDFSGKNLDGLDLAGLDFKKAKLAKANLFGADLTGADLTETDLRAALLDRVIIIGAKFDRANLAGASMLRPTTSTTLDEILGETPSFIDADLTGAKIFGNFNHGNFSRAKMRGASLAPFSYTGFIEHLWRTDLTGATLAAADLAGANLTEVSLRFADLRGANLSGAVLKHADLARADLTGADLTNADVSQADLDGAILTGAKGLATVTGLAEARARGKVID